MKMSAYKISDNFNGVEGSKVMSPHHSHPTNGDPRILKEEAIALAAAFNSKGSE